MYYVGYAVTTLPNEIRELQCSRGGREKKEAEKDGKEEEERGRWRLFVCLLISVLSPANHYGLY